MANVIKADLDDIVFEPREKGYGAYQLRKQYRNYLILAFLIVGATFAVATVGPFLWEKLKAQLAKDEEKKVSLNMADLPPPPPIEDKTPPPPPPPPPPPDEPPPPEKVVAFKAPEPKEIPEEKEDPPPPPKEEQQKSKLGDENQKGVDKGVPDGIPEGKGEPKPAEVAKDTDEDGIMDDEDDCPKEKGERKFRGCPPPPPPPPKVEEPDPNKFVFAQEQPKPINMDDVKKAIGYPPVAKEAGIEGQVMLRILVDEQGNYIRHIISKAAHPLLQAEVEKHARELHFTPAIQGGKPIKFWVNIPFNFKLQ